MSIRITPRQAPLRAINHPSLCDMSRVRIRFNNGMIARIPLFPAAQYVVRNDGAILDDDSRPILPSMVVILQRTIKHCMYARLHAGAEISVIDPGKDHSDYVLPWSTVHEPLLPKWLCQ